MRKIFCAVNHNVNHKFFFQVEKCKKLKQPCEVMCDKCHGFFQKSCYSRHSKLSILNFEVILQPLSLHFQKNELADYDSYPDDFKPDIIGAILHDKIGKICKVDKMILLFDCRLFDWSRRKLDKIGVK